MAETVQDDERAVADPLRFKARLGIGERAYRSLRLKNAAFEAWDVAGVAATGAAAAKSSLIAGTFFAGTGLLAWFDFGTPSTPLGWVVAAGIVSGALWLGLTRFLRARGGNRVTVIPHRINTPEAVLAAALVDRLGALAHAVAAADAPANAAEQTAIARHFVEDWGMDPAFVARHLAAAEDKGRTHAPAALAAGYGRFLRDAPDCDLAAMRADALSFLETLCKADSPPGTDLTAREASALAEVRRLLNAAGHGPFRRGLSRLRARRGKPRRLEA